MLYSRTFFKPKPPSVTHTGAAPHSILCGTAPHNQGLRVRTMQRQQGTEGPIEGPFVLIDAGANRHSSALAHLLGHMTDASEVLRFTRLQSPDCVSVVNANALSVERVSPPLHAKGTVSDPDC